PASGGELRLDRDATRRQACDQAPLGSALRLQGAFATHHLALERDDLSRDPYLLIRPGVGRVDPVEQRSEARRAEGHLESARLVRRVEGDGGRAQSSLRATIVRAGDGQPGLVLPYGPLEVVEPLARAVIRLDRPAELKVDCLDLGQRGLGLLLLALDLGGRRAGERGSGERSRGGGEEAEGESLRAVGHGARAERGPCRRESAILAGHL